MVEQDFGLIEQEGDLFDLDTSFALAHCVSVDLRMGAGIAVLFRDKYQGIDELHKQSPEIGGVWYLQRDRYVFYLITKQIYKDKPTYESLTQSLENCRALCESLEIRKLGIPRIGWGLDGLQWNQVKAIINTVFTGSGIQVVCCTPPEGFKGRARPYRGGRGRRGRRPR